MRILTPSAFLILLLSIALLNAAEPKRETLRAWDDYIGSVNTSVAERNAGSRPYLWEYDSPETQRRVLNGELVITKHDPRKVPQGLIRR